MKLKNMQKTKIGKREWWLITSLIPSGLAMLCLLAMAVEELAKRAEAVGLVSFGNQAFTLVFFFYLLTALPLGAVGLCFSVFRIFKKETLKWSVITALVNLFHIVFGGAMLVLLIQMLANLYSV